MGAHDQFRLSGGASGQQQTGDIGAGGFVIAVGEPSRDVHTAVQTVFGSGAWRGFGGECAVDQHHSQGGGVGAGLLGHLAQVGATVVVGHDDRHGLGEDGQMGQFVATMRG